MIKLYFNLENKRMLIKFLPNKKKEKISQNKMKLTIPSTTKEQKSSSVSCMILFCYKRKIDKDNCPLHKVKIIQGTSLSWTLTILSPSLT